MDGFSFRELSRPVINRASSFAHSLSGQSQKDGATSVPAAPYDFPFYKEPIKRPEYRYNSLGEKEYYFDSRGQKHVEALKVIMMNLKHNETIPPEKNSLVTHLLEKYHDLNRDYKKKDDEIEEVKKKIVEVEAELDEVNRKWSVQEENYKNNIKDLEGRLSQMEDGMKVVDMARKASLIQRQHGSLKKEKASLSKLDSALKSKRSSGAESVSAMSSTAADHGANENPAPDMIPPESAEKRDSVISRSSLPLSYTSSRVTAVKLLPDFAEQKDSAVSESLSGDEILGPAPEGPHHGQPAYKLRRVDMRQRGMTLSSGYSTSPEGKVVLPKLNLPSEEADEGKAVLLPKNRSGISIHNAKTFFGLKKKDKKDKKLTMELGPEHEQNTDNDANSELSRDSRLSQEELPLLHKKLQTLPGDTVADISQPGKARSFLGWKMKDRKLVAEPEHESEEEMDRSEKARVKATALRKQSRSPIEEEASEDISGRSGLFPGRIKWGRRVSSTNVSLLQNKLKTTPTASNVEATIDEETADESRTPTAFALKAKSTHKGDRSYFQNAKSRDGTPKPQRLIELTLKTPEPKPQKVGERAENVKPSQGDNFPQRKSSRPDPQGVNMVSSTEAAGGAKSEQLGVDTKPAGSLRRYKGSVNKSTRPVSRIGSVASMQSQKEQAEHQSQKDPPSVQLANKSTEQPAKIVSGDKGQKMAEKAKKASGESDISGNDMALAAARKVSGRNKEK